MNTSDKMARIAIDKHLQKEFTNDRIVYLNDGQEYQIQLYNPLGRRIGAEISIDGRDLAGMVIIRPGERIWLERYLDDARKFKFETYSVNNTAQNQSAIAGNGKIEIRFYDEVYGDIFRYPYKFNTDDHLYSIYTNDDVCVYNYATVTSDGAVNESATSLPTGGCTMTLTTQQNNWITDCSSNKYSNYNKKIETGRTEKGSHSDQKFSSTSFIPSNDWIYYECIQLKPISQKQVGKHDLQKVYCTNCGRRLKPEYKYCPVCGTKVE